MNTPNNIQNKLKQDYLDVKSKKKKIPNPYSWSVYNSQYKTRIYIPFSSCSQAAGAKEIFFAAEEYLKKHDVQAELVKTSCAGFCSVEPLMGVATRGRNPVFFKNVQSYDVEMILDSFFHAYIYDSKVFFQYRLFQTEAWNGVPFFEDISFFSNQSSLLLKNLMQTETLSLVEYVYYDGFGTLYKVLNEYTRNDILKILQDSELKGRGGEGFPTYLKWQIVKDTISDDKYVICNAHESDINSYVDRFLVENMPYNIIEGIAIAAYTVGASKAYIFLNSSNKFAISQINEALQNAYENGLLGDNIFESGFSLRIQVRESPGAMICGEETALISCIEGHRATPRIRPPYPSTNGLFGKPTLVNNVETLINVAAILKDNGQLFSKTGTKLFKGTKLFCLSGEVVNKGIIEVDMDRKISNIVNDIGGGMSNGNFKALLLGGLIGTFFSESEFDMQLTYEELQKHNAIIGAGGFFVMNDSTCIVDIIKYICEIQSNESCGKCIPCREGTLLLYNIMKRICERPTKDEKHEALDRFKGVLHMENVAVVMKQTSLCNFGKFAPQPLLSGLKLFKKEIEEHVFDRKCVTNTCRNLRKYYIDVEACTGCGQCSVRCSVSAIFGTPRATYTIINAKCISCGICQEVCKFNAVFYE